MTKLLTPTRRGFLTGLATFLAAPAIVRAASLMPVKAIKPLDFADAPLFNIENLAVKSTERYAFGYTGTFWIPALPVPASADLPWIEVTIRSEPTGAT